VNQARPVTERSPRGCIGNRANNAIGRIGLKIGYLQERTKKVLKYHTFNATWTLRPAPSSSRRAVALVSTPSPKRHVVYGRGPDRPIQKGWRIDTSRPSSRHNGLVTRAALVEHVKFGLSFSCDRAVKGQSLFLISLVQHPRFWNMKMGLFEANISDLSQINALICLRSRKSDFRDSKSTVHVFKS